jgi:hypothetical protein
LIRDNETRGLVSSFGGTCAGIYNLGDSLNIERNHILCNHGYGIWIEANNCKIKANDLKNGIRIEDSDSTIIINNMITAISIFCQYSTNTLIESNTFLENAFILNDIVGGGKNDRSWTIIGNSFTGNDLYTAIHNTQHAIIKNNKIRGYTDGIVNQGKATIENNEVIDNSHYGISTSVMLDSFARNNIFNNLEYDFHYTAAVDQTATLNYWGTTNSSEIMNNIYDHWDEITLGKVIFEPFAPKPFAFYQVAEITGTWAEGIWYWDAAASKWTQMTSYATTGDIASGDFTGDGKADVASCWDADGLWYQNGATLGWTKVADSAPDSVTCGDVTGN